jgi:hypothetical protein
MITVGTAIVGVALASTSAYAFSRWRFPGRNAGLIFLLTTQMIPAAMLMVPLYILALRNDLIGSYRGLIITYSVTAVPFSIWILKGYYDTIPRELEEAALIDGAGGWPPSGGSFCLDASLAIVFCSTSRKPEQVPVRASFSATRRSGRGRSACGPATTVPHRVGHVFGRRHPGDDPRGHPLPVFLQVPDFRADPRERQGLTGCAAEARRGGDGSLPVPFRDPAPARKPTGTAPGDRA